MSVFYVKYRPQRVAELDSERVRATLEKILASEEMPSCFLFTGPKGSGKTSAARILAKSINCLKVKNGEPCGKCLNCKQIDSGRAMDVIEIDAASNRGIDDIRELREKAYLLPTSLPKKVFIIDEVHMLTKEAFNALLKLIEEPPKHTIFVMCTTDSQKIPETVLSRLVRVDFRKGSREELKESLRRVIKAEGLEVAGEVMEMVIDRSEGSFRNGRKILTELYLELGKKMTVGGAEKVLMGKTGNYAEVSFESDLVAGKAAKIMQRLEEMAESGINFSDYRQRLVVYFQQRLLGYYGIGGKEDLKMAKEELVRWLGLLINAGKQEKEVELEQLPLQLAVAEFGGETREPEKKTILKTKANKIEKKKINIEETVGVEMEMVEKEWGRILEMVKPHNHSIEAFLRAARPKRVDGKSLVIEVFYPFHKERLEDERNRQVVEGVLAEVLKRSINLECVLAKDKKAPLVINNETPIAQIVKEDEVVGPTKDIYDVAKEIFG